MSIRTKWIIPLSVLGTLMMTGAGTVGAQESKLLLDLRGQWSFELGDDRGWAKPGYDDSKWTEIKVPSAWEDQGYPGYDGYAWYRKHFHVNNDWTRKDLLLVIGAVDDVDEVYINGEFIGTSGSFPPQYITAYNVRRKYLVPASLLRPSDDNVIAVRVYDSQLSGGIVSGPVGLYERRDVPTLDLNLPSTWKFKTGDDMKWKDVNFDDSGWKELRVPSYWDNQGYRDYDGFAWYRVKFMVPAGFPDRDLVLLMGKIDDVDETYLNGERVGKTGDMPPANWYTHGSAESSYQRQYTIPPGCLRVGGENVLAVRVYDGYLYGGIYEGPIGIFTREHFLKYKHSVRNSGDWLKDLIEEMFH